MYVAKVYSRTAILYRTGLMYGLYATNLKVVYAPMGLQLTKRLTRV